MSNLVDNALRFTPDGGKIEIAVAKNANGGRGVGADNGSGIASEHLPRVFDRFYRADASRSSTGTGLGLALVKSIADLHGGSARVQSEVGRGTTVTLRVPESRRRSDDDGFLTASVTSGKTIRPERSHDRQRSATTARTNGTFFRVCDSAGEPVASTSCMNPAHLHIILNHIPVVGIPSPPPCWSTDCSVAAKR